MQKLKCERVDSPKLIDTYFNDVVKYQTQFGEKTVVYIQVGDFYEIYSAELPDGKKIGVLHQIADICNLNISQKKVCLGINSDAKVFMGGFPIYMLDKFVNIAVDDNGWTVVVIKQDEQCSGSTRSVEGIYSPGTNMRTSEESNCIVLVVIERARSRIIKNQSTIYIGMSSIDSISGQTTVYETFAIDQNTILTYDEIQKFISAKNPREVLIETSNLPDDISETDLINAMNLSNRAYRYNFVQYGYTEKLIDTQTKFFERIYQHKSKANILDVLGLGFKEYGRLSLMLLLKYILDHSTIMLNKIYEPEVWEMNTQLILANNSLEQLNIIDNRFVTKETSLLRILDMSSTVIGRRGFRNRILNPIRNPEVIKARYAEIKAFMDFDVNGIPNRNFYLSLENELRNIRDLERYHRRIAMNTLTPNEIPGVINSYNAILLIHDIIATKSIYSDVIKNLLPTQESWLKFKEACASLEAKFDLEKTTFNTLEKVDKNFFKFGCNEKLDEHQLKINQWLNVFKEIADWIDTMIDERDTNRILKKVAKFDYNEQFQHHIFLTRNRFDIFQKRLEEEIKRGNNEFVVRVIRDPSNPTNISDMLEYKIPFKSFSFENKSRSANNNDVVIILENNDKNDKYKNDKLKKPVKGSLVSDNLSILEKINHKLRQEMDILKATVISVYKEVISDFSDKYLLILRDITNFVVNVDIVKTGAKMAIEKSYIEPEIVCDPEEESPSSFIDFEGIRHPIIEHINQKIHYVDNNVVLGKDKLDGILLFGVNASGKSSLMKAIGINLILAQAGFFVAAKSMKYYPFDYLFTRIWNNDNIFKGQSTFEVEISELKSIIKHASARSLVLGDELCSGTETVSATAIVTAGIKKLSKSKAKFIFATHLHFLADSQHLITLDNVKNYHLSVIYDQASKKLIYDRKLKEGSGPSTYGLEVCKAMAIDDDFIEDAFKIRAEITNESLGSFLNNKPSKYNSNVRIDKCQVCNSPGEDVHHIQFQCNADNNGKIGNIDKNRESNLVVLCKKCHNSVHHPRGTLKITGYIETSEGIQLHYSQKNIEKSFTYAYDMVI